MGDKNYLISVIIPVYKTEQYIEQCILSVINQTYKNLEIILVDDGSPDNCPSICDNWAKKDSRIKVIHKINEGLSAARNSGLDICTGDFIAFLDSDDYVSPFMYEHLLNSIIEHQTDIAACKILRFNQNRKFKLNNFVYKKNYDRISYLKSLVLRKVDCASWNKLYSKKFIGASRFKNGRNNEDFLWLFYRFYDNEYKIVYLDEFLYYYRITPNSITTTSKTNPHTFDSYKNVKEMLAYDVQGIIRNELMIYTFRLAINFSWRFRHLNNNESDFYTELNEIKDILLKNKVRILFSKEISLKEKIKYLLSI